jgi:hypothetical protein
VLRSKDVHMDILCFWVMLSRSWEWSWDFCGTIMSKKADEFWAGLSIDRGGIRGITPDVEPRSSSHTT